MGDSESIVKKGHRGEDPGSGPDFARPPGGNLDNRMEGEAGGQTVRDVVREHEQGDGRERGDELRHVVVGNVARGREHEQAHDDQRGSVGVAQGPAASPVRTPSRLPVADSMYAPAVDLPTRPLSMQVAASTIIGFSISV